MTGYPRYELVVYHDEPEDAATDSHAAWPFQTIGSAKQVVRDLLREPYWNGGAEIRRGTYYPPILGVEPERFEDDPDGLVWCTWNNEIGVR